MATLLRGTPVARELMAELEARVGQLQSVGVVPRLATIRVGERGDDVSYERNIARRCEAAGVELVRHTLPATCTNDDLMTLVHAIGSDGSVHGCLLFRPLAAPLDEEALLAALDPAKDVDGATPISLFGTFAGQDCGFAPCTPEACLRLLDYYGVELDGARVAIVGRSLVVGRPLAMLLLARNATPTICHTHTPELERTCREADIVVSCAGHVGTITEACVRAGQVVVDVGTNWDAAAGKLVGDVDAACVEPVVDALSPVPGGVGAITTAVLVEHVVRAAERAVAERASSPEDASYGSRP